MLPEGALNIAILCLLSRLRVYLRIEFGTAVA
jgi:hypothetical protein